MAKKTQAKPAAISKPARPKSSLEQLRSRVWPSRQDAVAELKRNGFAERGADYKIGMASSGQWHVMPLDEETTTQDEPPAAAIGAAIAAGIATGTVKVKQLPERNARGIKASAQKKAAAKAPAKKAAAKQPATKKADEPEPRKAPAAEPVPPPPEGADLSPLPTRDDYALCITKQLRGNSIVAQALEISRQTRLPVEITGRDGEVIRRIDAAVVKAQRASRAGSTGRVGARGPRATSGKTYEVAQLLQRPKGATKQELMAITEWSFGERYIRRIAGTHKLEIKTLGKDHWRLVKPSA